MKKSLSMLSSAALIITAICTTILITVVTKAGSAFPNDDSEKIEQMVDKLVNKLLITEAQAKAIKTILEEYFRDFSAAGGDAAKEEALKQGAIEKISALLDKKQKMKFDIIESDWWLLANE